MWVMSVNSSYLNAGKFPLCSIKDYVHALTSTKDGTLGGHRECHQKIYQGVGQLLQARVSESRLRIRITFPINKTFWCLLVSRGHYPPGPFADIHKDVPVEKAFFYQNLP